MVPLDKDFIWLDAGTADSLLEAGNTIKKMQESGRYAACIEETALKNGFIDENGYFALGEAMKSTKYGQYILGMDK